MCFESYSWCASISILLSWSPVVDWFTKMSPQLDHYYCWKFADFFKSYFFIYIKDFRICRLVELLTRATFSWPSEDLLLLNYLPIRYIVEFNRSNYLNWVIRILPICLLFGNMEICCILRMFDFLNNYDLQFNSFGFLMFASRQRGRLHDTCFVVFVPLSAYEYFFCRRSSYFQNWFRMNIRTFL